MLVSLIGMPGSGKSTIGRQLARRLQMSFFDSDQLIEERIGCSIRQYFEMQGEARFRDIEEEVLDELSSMPNGILATGGGAVLRLANREHLRERSKVVYLKSSPEELFRRLRHDRNRPLLQVNDPMDRLVELYAERDPLYQQTAHCVFETGRPSVAILVTMILTQLELSGDKPVG